MQVTIQELRDYEKYVENMASLADGRVILNHTVEHAEIILAQIFRSAERKVKVVTGKLDESVYGSDRLVDAVSNFLRVHGEATVDVVSEQHVADSHRLLVELGNSGLRDRFTISVLKSGWEAKSHFTVADARHLRFEADPEKCEAVVMFGNEKNGLKLQAAFEKYAAVAG